MPIRCGKNSIFLAWVIKFVTLILVYTDNYEWQMEEESAVIGAC